MAFNYLEEKGFKKVIRYSELGTYNEMVSEKAFESITDPLYDPKQTDVPSAVYKSLNAVLDVLYESERRFTPDWFKKDLTYSQVVNEGKEIVEQEIRKIIIDLDKAYKANNYASFSIQFMNQLFNMPYGRIAVGNTLFDSLVEEALMNFRNTIVNKNKNLNSSQPKPVESNEQYNKAVSDYLGQLEQTVLTVGAEVDLNYKNSDSDGIATITEIQKLNNGMFKVKLSPSAGKEYTFVVNNFGEGEKITIEPNSSIVFEIAPNQLESARTKLNSLQRIEEPLKQGYLSSPVISTEKEVYKISELTNRDEQGNLVEEYRKPAIEKEGYRITFAEHPDAVFFATPTYWISRGTGVEIKTGWQIDSVNSGLRVVSGDTISKTLDAFNQQFKKLENVSLNNDQVVGIISKAGMDITKLTPAEDTFVKYTFYTLPFSKEEKESILANFTAKYMKDKSVREAQIYIESALEKADEQGQNNIIEKLKECYK
jgi:hypothetical protein